MILKDAPRHQTANRRKLIGYVQVVVQLRVSFASCDAQTQHQSLSWLNLNGCSSAVKLHLRFSIQNQEVNSRTNLTRFTDARVPVEVGLVIAQEFTEAVRFS